MFSKGSCEDEEMDSDEDEDEETEELPEEVVDPETDESRLFEEEGLTSQEVIRLMARKLTNKNAFFMVMSPLCLNDGHAIGGDTRCGGSGCTKKESSATADGNAGCAEVAIDLDGFSASGP